MSDDTRTHAVRTRRAAHRERSTASRLKASERAVRAAHSAGLSAQPERPFPGPFLRWVVARMCALTLMILTAVALYDVATSAQFQVRSIRVTGIALLSQGEIERSAAVMGANLFWVNPSEVEGRVRSFPAIQRVVATPIFPDTVLIEIVERQPVAVWRSGGVDLVVDKAGVVIDRATGPLGHLSLPSVTETDAQTLEPGARVDPRVLTASMRLASLLPASGLRPTGFEWSANGGLEVPTEEGVRIRFDPSASIDSQVAVLGTVRHYLSTAKESATLIDVRFADRPYYQ